MPMAKKKPNTVARLAMGTAILTVIAGCDNRVGQGIVQTTAPVMAALDNTAVVVTERLTPVTQAVARTPGVVLETLSPSTTAIVQPEYVVPGMPTYTEGSQAANVQTFESIYGRPVSTDPSQALAASNTYAIPSYDDGAVTAQPLAPVTSYTQQDIAATAPTYDTMPDSAAGFVYGDTLTSEAYTVVTEPVVVDSMPMAGGTVPMVGTFQTTEPVPFDPFGVAPAAPMSVTTETYTLESMPTFAPDAMILEPIPAPVPMSAPMIGSDASAFPLSYDEAIPMTDASAGFVVMSEPVAFEATMDVLPQMVVDTFAPAAQDAVPVFGGVQIIGNDEAEATYGAMPATGGPGDRSETALSPSPFGTLAYGQPLASFETATLAATLETSPLPSPKRVRSASTAFSATAGTDGPLTAPVPRRRPSGGVDSGYATLTAPLPQPRPDYGNPVASATTSGAYISIGALPGVEEERIMARDAEAAPVRVQAASIQTTEPASADGSLSELSGTSWRLAEVDGMPVSVNTELHFDGSSGFAGGQGPCNSYGGEFANAGKGLFSMANIFSTDTSCPTIEVENRYLEALKRAGTYEIATGFSEMTLLDGNGRPIVRFKAF